MLDKNVSWFENTKSTQVKGTLPLMQVLIDIEEGKYSSSIKKLRGGDEEEKKQLPMVAVHGLFNQFRKKDLFYESSGIIIIDIDNIDKEDIPDAKDEIMSNHPNVLAAMTSPSGDGIKLLFAVEESIVTVDSYRSIGSKIGIPFREYGDIDVLSITDCLIMTWDPDIRINQDAYPKLVFVESFEQKKVNLEPLDKTQELWDDAEAFFETVLYQDISSKTNNNFHFLQVSMLDLKKFGFSHPEDDLKFLIEYSEELFKESESNGQRFLDLVDICKNYPQAEWPYKTTKPEEEFEEEWEVDYSDYIKKKDDSVKTDETGLSSEDVEVEDNGLIHYKKFMSVVMDKIKEGNRVGKEISLKNFADKFRFKGTGILTVTGIPGHGKTEFVDQILIDLARLYGDKALVAGFEQSPEEHVVKLSRKIIGKDITCPSYYSVPTNLDRIESAVSWVSSRIKHFDTAKVGGNIAKILQKAAIIKNEFDYNYLVIDPFNMISIKSRAGGHEKIEEILRMLTMFSHQTGILIILVAHPFKMKKDEKTGEYEIPDFYSVKGSSSFFEMSYHGLCIYRRSSEVLVRVLKVKQNNLGTTGADIIFDYDKPSGRYIPLNEKGEEYLGDHGDTDWLEKAEELENV